MFFYIKNRWEDGLPHHIVLSDNSAHPIGCINTWRLSIPSSTTTTTSIRPVEWGCGAPTTSSTDFSFEGMPGFFSPLQTVVDGIMAQFYGVSPMEIG